MEITGVLTKIAAVLNKIEIPYAVTGGVAVTVWGRARYTADVDIIVDIAPQKIKQLVGALLKIDIGVYLDIDIETSIDVIKQRSGFNLIHSQSGVKADFVIKKDDEFSQIEIQRAIKKDFHGQKINFISPEDLILIKLLWHKNSGSTRHLEDAESILKITEVDLEYINDWAGKQSTMEILKNLLGKIKSEHE
ncbi:MAG: nucleotidyl transferase AbiEii/AbiGii toxin family protein [Patescibacteria group bacterium]